MTKIDLKYYLTLFLVIFTITSCDGQNLIYSGKIKILAVDHKSNDPIPFLKFDLEKESFNRSYTIQNLDGLYLIDSLQKGTYKLNIETVGYEKQKLKVSVNNHKTTTVRISLRALNLPVPEIEWKYPKRDSTSINNR